MRIPLRVCFRPSRVVPLPESLPLPALTPDVMAHHRPLDRHLRRWLFYPLQAVLIYTLYGLCAALPLAAASALGGWVAQTLGPRLRVSRRARSNLALVFPGLSDSSREAIVSGMWDNLGRSLAEHPHLDQLWAAEESGRGAQRIEIVGREWLPRPGGGACLMFSAHLANWELLPAGAARQGLPLTSVYRRPNNPYLHRLMTRHRRVGQGELVPKGREGARALIAALVRGGTVAMLVDQKMNDGIAVPFFGLPAMTAPAIAQLALKFRCPVIPVRTERLDGARYRLTLSPPLDLPDSGNRNADILALMTRINAMVEEWIRARPEQWLWLHNRWP